VSQSVVVLDLGTSKAVALKATLDEKNGLEIKGLVTVDGRGIKKGAISSIEDAARAADTALRHLAQELGENELTDVVVTISGSQLEGSTVQGFKPIIPKNRMITGQDVMEVVKHSRSGLFPPERVQIQTIPREFRVDEKRNISQPVGMTGGKLEVLSFMVTGLTSHVKNFESALEMLDRKVNQFVYAPLAAGIGVLTPQEILEGALVVDIGASKTDVAVFSEGALAYAICIPVGGNSITSDLSQLLNTSAEEAERLKIEHGAALSQGVAERDAVDVKQLGQPQARPMQRKVLCEIIESRVTELARILKNYVDKSGYGSSVKHIVLTGGTSHLRNVSNVFESTFEGSKVRQAEPQVFRGKSNLGLANVVGAAQFILQTYDDLEPISGTASWQERVKGLWTLLSGKS
jgi:cell division protein FtsA